MKPNPEMIDEVNPEWTDEDFRTAMSFDELQAEVKRRFRGPQKKPTKELTAVRFDPDVIAALRAMGRGWQTRLNEQTREWLKQQSRL